MFDVVINHFCGRERAPHVVASALLCATLAIRSPYVARVIVIDGSAQADAGMETDLAAAGCEYKHFGRRLNFAEGYNAGCALATAEWIVLCASDIYPSAEVFTAAAELIGRKPDIGCVIPHLTNCDVPSQEGAPYRRRAYPTPLMTLNMNFFKASVLSSVGGVPSAYSGGYNDFELVIALRKLGLLVYILPVVCLHYGKLTIAAGGSNYDSVSDARAFADRHPEYYDDRGLWSVRLTKFAISAPLRSLFVAAELLPAWLRRPIERRLLRFV